MKRVVPDAFSLVEVLIVVAILGVITVTGYRSVMYLTSQATQLSRAAASARHAEFERLSGMLDDRLSRSWSFTVEAAASRGVNGDVLHLYDSDGRNFADFGLYSDGIVFDYVIADVGTVTPLSLEYFFTNQNAGADYAFQFVTNTQPESGSTVFWKIPPPFYYQAATEAFRPLFLSADNNDLEQMVTEHRTNHSGLLQHDLREYHFNPKEHAFR